MARPKELTAADKFYLDSHLNNDIAEIAEAVKNTQEVVKEYITAKKTGQLPIGTTIINKTSAQGKSGVAIMTEAASQICDEARKNSSGKRVNDPSIIFPCKPKD